MIVLDGRTLTLEQIAAVADGAAVTLGDEARAAVTASI